MPNELKPRIETGWGWRLRGFANRIETKRIETGRGLTAEGLAKRIETNRIETGWGWRLRGLPNELIWRGLPHVWFPKLVRLKVTRILLKIWPIKLPLYHSDNKNGFVVHFLINLDHQNAWICISAEYWGACQAFSVKSSRSHNFTKIKKIQSETDRFHSNWMIGKPLIFKNRGLRGLPIIQLL